MPQLRALKKFGVNVMISNVDETQPDDIYYAEFYRFVICDIQEKLNQSKENSTAKGEQQ